MSVLKQLAFAGGKITSLSEDAVAYASGSGVSILSLSTGAMVFLEPRPTAPAQGDSSASNELLGGVTALDSCGSTQQLAVATHSLSPVIMVYDYPSLELMYILTGGAKLNFADVAFSSDGKRIAAISKLPDFSLTIWDAETQQILCKTKLPEPCKSVSFNPLNDDQLCTCGEKGLFMWNVKKTQDSINIGSVKLMIKAIDEEDEEDADSDEDDADLEFEEAQGPRNDFVCHCWNVDGKVYAATRSGEAYTITPAGATAIEVFPAFYPASAPGAEAPGPDEDEARLVMRGIFVTKSHIVAIHSDGKARWIARGSFDVQRVVDLASFVKEEITVGESTWVIPVTAAITPGFLTIIVGTADGILLSLPSANGEAGDAEDFDAEAFADAGADVAVQKLLDLHADSVYGVCSIKSDLSTLFTAAADGSVRLWDAAQGAMLSKKMLSTQPFVCAASSKLAPLVALGTVDGMIRIMVVKRPSMESDESGADMKTIYYQKLFTSALTQAAFHPSLPLLALASMVDGRVYILRVASSNIAVIASAAVQKPYSLAWIGDNSGNGDLAPLLIGCGDGVLWSADVPTGENAPAASDPDLLRRAPLTLTGRGKFARGASLEIIADGAPGSVSGGQTMFVANSTSKSIQQIVLSRDPVGENSKLLPAAQYPGHKQNVLCIERFDPEHSASETIIATGGKDGLINIWTSTADASKGESKLLLGTTLSGHSAGVVRMSFSADAQRLLSVAVDGSIILWDLSSFGGARGSRIAPQTEPDSAYLELPGIGPEDVDGSLDDDPTESDALMSRLEASYQLERKQENEKLKAEKMHQFTALKAELNALYDHNNKVDDLEKLENNEFIMNLKERDSIVREGDSRASQVEMRIERENLTRKIIWKRLMQELWHSMDQKGKQLHSISEMLVVHNFAVPVVPEERIALYERVAMQRRIELREIKESFRTTTWPGVTEEMNNGKAIDWIVNEGKLSAVTEVKTEADILAAEAEAASSSAGNDDNRGNAADGEDDGEQTKEETLLEMLYRPLALRTSAQKRAQILFLEQLIREIKSSFNKRFEDTFAIKEEKIDEIRTKNVRISEILKELKVEEEFFKPSWNEKEFPEKVITVEDSEVPVEKYISEMDRKRLKEEEEERVRLAAQNVGDNAPERALMEMMGGTLEVETDMNTLEQELIREEWMDELLYEEMSEEQRKKLEDFEARQKALLEEKEKYRKGLELELKKLKTEVSELCRYVDERVSELFKLRISTQMQIYVQELYSLRLVLVLMEEEDDLRELSKIREEIAKKDVLRKAAKADFDKFSSLVSEKRTEIESLQNEEKGMDKSFKRIMQEMSPGGNVDSETLAVLTSLYKTRSTGEDVESGMPANSAAIRSSVLGTGGASIEEIRALIESKSALLPETSPFFEKQLSLASREPELAKRKIRAQQLKPLDLENEVPEGFEVPDEVFQKLQELRLSRINFELTIKDKEHSLHTELSKESLLRRNVEVLDSEIADLQAARAELNERMNLATTNIEVLLKLKQGRDEIKQEAVVTDYTDALVIPEEVVSALNEKIRELGKGKVGVLTKIKDFNKEINHMLWECSYLKMMVRHTEEKYLDYHMLRVTKDLQAFLKGGSGLERQRVAVDKAEATYEYMKKAHAQKCKKLNFVKNKIEKQRREKRKENLRLKKHVDELERNVSLRASIHRARAAGGDGTIDDAGAASRRRMQSIVTRRKLIDLARAQTDEIEFLRQELDRLRQRTFPSFATRNDGIGHY